MLLYTWKLSTPIQNNLAVEILLQFLCNYEKQNSIFFFKCIYDLIFLGGGIDFLNYHDN